MGADLVGVAALQPAHLRPGTQSDAPYPFAVVCAIATDYDPREAKGLGGQLAVQNGAVVNHHLRNYIRELGYRASIGGADPLAVAVAAGLGTLDRNGRLVTKMRRSYISRGRPDPHRLAFGSGRAPTIGHTTIAVAAPAS